MANLQPRWPFDRPAGLNGFLTKPSITRSAALYNLFRCLVQLVPMPCTTCSNALYNSYQALVYPHRAYQNESWKESERSIQNTSQMEPWNWQIETLPEKNSKNTWIFVGFALSLQAIIINYKTMRRALHITLVIVMVALTAGCTGSPKNSLHQFRTKTVMRLFRWCRTECMEMKDIYRRNITDIRSESRTWIRPCRFRCAMTR